MFNCEADDESKLSNYVGFEQGDLPVEIKKDSLFTKTVQVAASEVSSSDRTYSIYVDGASTLGTYYEVPETVTIPANTNVGSFDVVLTDDETLEYFDQTLIFQWEGERGLNISNPVTLNVTELCELTLISVVLEFDDYPGEAYFQLVDFSSGSAVLLYDSRNELSFSGLTTYEHRFCLDDGDYGIAVYDSYGDGGTDYTVSIKGEDIVLSEGSVPDAGSGYPVVTNISDIFTIE
ncbi:hypothetical protein [Winogradskyella arenosi]|nr:hypothetical protein [Winogradskyella arenosi]